MSDTTSRSALLVLDVQVGLADQAFAVAAVDHIHESIDRARDAGLLVVYSRVAFRPGYLDVASWNRAFASYAAADRLPPEASQLIPALQPRLDEPVLAKARFSPFAGTDLSTVLRAQSVDRIVLTGLTTAGVVLAAFSHAENHDLEITVLSDACADPDPDLHAALTGMFSRSATVTATKDWQPA